MSKEKKLQYDTALQELQEIVNQLQEDSIGMEELLEKVKKAAELISFCKERLRYTETEIEDLFADKKQGD